MLRRVSLFAIAVIVTFYPRPALAIVGGALDGTDHPNVGAFVLIDLQNPIPGFDGTLPDVCGTGTLIHPRVAVVAGHGTAVVEEDLAAGYYTLDDLKFSFGSNAKDDGTWLNIAAVTTHPDYFAPLNNAAGGPPLVDIGLVIFDTPVMTATPAPLATNGLLDSLHAAGELDDARFTVVGYGAYGDAPNAVLPPDGLRRVAESEFLRLADRWLWMDQNSAHGNGGTGWCDSGGPTFWVDTETGKEILVATSSRGDAALAATGVTHRLDTPEAIDFINSVIKAVDAGEYDVHGNSQLTGTSSIPEPSALILAVLGACTGVSWRRRCR